MHFNAPLMLLFLCVVRSVHRFCYFYRRKNHRWKSRIVNMPRGAGKEMRKTRQSSEEKKEMFANAARRTTANNKRITSKLTNKAIANGKRFTCAIVHISMSSPHVHTCHSFFHRLAVVFAIQPNGAIDAISNCMAIFDLHKMQIGRLDWGRSAPFSRDVCCAERNWWVMNHIVGCNIVFAFIHLLEFALWRCYLCEMHLLPLLPFHYCYYELSLREMSERVHMYWVRCECGGHQFSLYLANARAHSPHVPIAIISCRFGELASLSISQKIRFFLFVSFAIDFLNDLISDQPTCIPFAPATSPSVSLSLSLSLSVSISLCLSLSSVGWQIELPLRMGMDNDVWSHWILYVYVTQTMTYKKDVK